MAQAAFSRIDRPDIDALVVPGGNFPTMDSIAAWEQQFGKPVITTNQAALWAVMRAMRISTPLSGKGRLLEQLPEAGRKSGLASIAARTIGVLLKTGICRASHSLAPAAAA